MTWFRSPALLALPALLFVFALALWPLAEFLLEGFRHKDSWSLLQFRRLIASGSFWVVLSRTLGVALVVTLVCLVLAYPVAYALVRVSPRVKIVMIGLIVLPYLTSVIVRTYAWAAILALQGPVNVLLQGMGLIDEPMLLGHSNTGILLGMVHIQLPIAILTLWAAMEKIDRQQITVAASLGAPKTEGFFTVYFPQSLAGVGSAATLVYILSLGAYVIPQTLGGTRGLLFAQLLVDQATTLLNWNLAAAMAIVMLVTAAAPALALVLIRRLTLSLQKRRRSISGGAGAWLGAALMPVLNAVPAGLWSFAWKAATAFVLTFLLLPELVILLVSFGPPKQISFPPQYLGLEGYRTTLGDPSWMVPLGRSVGYAAIDAVIATALGALAAYSFARSPRLWGRIGMIALALPIVLPEIVIAISYFIFANKLSLTGTSTAIVLGQGAAAVGLAVVILSGVMRQLDEGLEHAAMMAGASRLRALRDIVVPLAAPGLVVAFVYSFLHAFDNLVLPLFIAGTKATITVRMFLSIQEELTAAPAVVASLMIAVLTIGLILALTLGRKKAAGILPLPGASK